MEWKVACTDPHMLPITNVLDATRWNLRIISNLISRIWITNSNANTATNQLRQGSGYANVALNGSSVINIVTQIRTVLQMLAQLQQPQNNVKLPSRETNLMGH